MHKVLKIEISFITQWQVISHEQMCSCQNNYKSIKCVVFFKFIFLVYDFKLLPEFLIKPNMTPYL